MAALPVIIDGGVMEGGGQILRMATALSCLTGQPMRVHNIRAGRSKPGLRPQHLCGLELLKDISRGKLEGDEVGSTEIVLYPDQIQSGSFMKDTHTAGSVGLLFQVSLPCALFAPTPTKLTFKGGTNAEFAPQIDYTLLVMKPILEKFGVHFTCDIIRRGYFPKGGGEIRITVEPIKQLNPIQLMDPGELTKITGSSWVAGSLPIDIANSMAKAAGPMINKEYPEVPVNIDTRKEPKESAVGNGNGIILVAETTTGCLLGASSLGKKGVQAQDVGKQAAESLLKNLEHGGCVDEYLQDQLIIFMALANGVSRVYSGPITLHTETAIHITKLLTKAEFSITPANDGSECVIIECHGIGLTNKHL